MSLGGQQSPSEWREAMREEAEVILDAARFGVYEHRAVAYPWHVLDMSLLILVPALATSAGFVGLRQFAPSWVAPALAFLAAVVSAAAATVGRAAHVSDHHQAAKGYLLLDVSAKEFLGGIERQGNLSVAQDELRKLYDLWRSVVSAAEEPAGPPGRYRDRYRRYRSRRQTLDASAQQPRTPVAGAEDSSEDNGPTGGCVS